MKPTVRIGVLACVLATVLMLQPALGGSSHKWEFAAVYDLHESAETGNYTIYFSKKGGKYADAICNFSYVTTAAKTTDGIETVEAAAETLWDGSATEVLGNRFSGKLATNTLYSLKFDQTTPRSAYRFTVASDSAHAFFFQHLTSELDFELLDASGKAYKATATEPGKKSGGHHDDHGKSNVGLGVVACLIVSFCTLIGIVVTLPCIKSPGNPEFLITTSAAFACGALLSVSVLIIIPESVRIIDGAWGYGNENLNNFFVGIALFLGFIVNLGINWAFGVQFNEVGTAKEIKEIEMGNVNQLRAKVGKSTDLPQTNDKTPDSKFAIRPKKWGTVVGPVLVGDFLHNFADGLAVMIAFTTCDAAMGWAVMAGAVAHELPQEWADFLVLRGAGKMSTFEALLMNFLSGLSCMIGGAIAASAPVGKELKCFILAFAAGAYVWIGCVECMPKLLTVKKKDRLLHFAIVMLGFAIIAIILTLHKHCENMPAADEGGAAADPHAGHGH